MQLYTTYGILPGILPCRGKQRSPIRDDEIQDALRVCVYSLIFEKYKIPHVFLFSVMQAKEEDNTSPYNNTRNET